MAQTQPVIAAKLHRGSKTINITASARPAENGADGPSSISHARSANTHVSLDTVYAHSCMQPYLRHDASAYAAEHDGHKAVLLDLWLPGRKCVAESV